MSGHRRGFRVGSGGKFDLVFENGLFRRVIGPTDLDKMAADALAEDVFMIMVRRFNAQDRNVTDRNGTSYAPALFAEQPDNQGVTKAQFKAAMNRLFTAGKIEIVDRGRPYKPARTIVPKGG